MWVWTVLVCALEFFKLVTLLLTGVLFVDASLDDVRVDFGVGTSVTFCDEVSPVDFFLLAED